MFTSGQGHHLLFLHICLQTLDFRVIVRQECDVVLSLSLFTKVVCCLYLLRETPFSKVSNNSQSEAT